jgi:phosphate transport system permease protein
LVGPVAISVYAPPPVSSLATEPNPARAARQRRTQLNNFDFRANRAFKWLALGGGLLVAICMLAILYQVLSGASMAFDRFGIGFIGHTRWVPATTSAEYYSGWPLIYGTLVTGVGSIFLSTILGVSIGLFLALLAPRRISTIIGPLVEMLAAIPSVVLGLIGIVLICPFLRSDIEPAVHSVLGWIPIFGAAQPVGNSLFAAILVLTIMVVPIIAALTRDLFRTVPIELRDGAEALGSTRWEMIRCVVLPTTRSGVVAACVLGFGRAIGEAIAVAEVVGGSFNSPLNLFQGGATLASQIATQFGSPVSTLQTSALFYLAAILFLFSVATNMTARWISGGAIKPR